MGKTSSASKRKYNKAAYKRYEFSVGLDKKLNYYLEAYKENGGNISELIKTTLASHFGIKANEDFYPYRYDKNGDLVQKEFLEELPKQIKPQ